MLERLISCCFEVAFAFPGRRCCPQWSVSVGSSEADRSLCFFFFLSALTFFDESTMLWYETVEAQEGGPYTLYDRISPYTVIQGPPPINASWGHTPTKPPWVKYGLIT